jgi:WD40 repeat protein
LTAAESAVVRLRAWGAGRPTAGLGLLVGADKVVTCAHVVNAALGCGLLEERQPGLEDLVQVEFPLLPNTPLRAARVVAWAAPRGRSGGGDVAGLVLSEPAPAGAAPARFTVAPPGPGMPLRAFGYPGSPERSGGMWVDAELKGVVGGGLLQVESLREQSVKAQPGYSGSPAWEHGGDEAIGLLQVAPFGDEPERDAYLLPPLAIAQVWEEPFDYLLVPDNPYRGLEPFTVEQAGMFFGRDADIAALAGRVRTQPVVVVVGPSGVGKSSLVQAGLTTQLRKEQRWSLALVQPGGDPWLQLAAALVRAQRGQLPEVTLEEARREAGRLRLEGLSPVARFLRTAGRPLLVVVDQFEELLAGGHPDQDLLELLLPTPGTADDDARLVVTLRGDFLPSLQSIPGFHRRLNERLYLLSPLTADEMRLAVTRPAAAHGVSFEPGLVDQILRDAAEGTLPLLEFTLTMLWKAQRRRTLTFSGYHEMGGVHGALEQVAEESASRLAPDAAEVLDRVLLKLVRTYGPGRALATRQRVTQASVPATEWGVLQRLADARLVLLDTDVADGKPYAELAHETLITGWKRLHELVADSFEFLTWLSWLRQRAADNELLPQERIAEARHWVQARPVDIPADLDAFIRNSETAIEARLRELREAKDQAEAAARRAEALRLAAQAELALRSGTNVPVTVALALSTESVLTEPTLPGDIALRRVLRVHPDTLVSLDHYRTVLAVAFSPDGTLLATISEDGPVQVFDARSGQVLARLDHPPGEQVLAVAFSPYGTHVATGSDDGWVRVFSAEAPEERARLEHGEPVLAVAFSPDGSRVFTGSDHGGTRVLNAETWKELTRLSHGSERVRAVAFSPDGSRVVTASDAGETLVFDAESGRILTQLNHGGERVWDAAFSPDGTRIATGSDDGWARVFDAESGRELARLRHSGESVEAVAFSPDGTRIATGSDHGSARVFDAESGQMLARLDHDGPVRTVAFSPDGSRVATGSADESARIFHTDPESEQLVRLNDHDERVWALGFSPDATRVATGTMQGLVRVFDARSGHLLARLDNDARVRAVAFSPDGTRIATGSDHGWAGVFDAESGRELTRLDHHGDWVTAVAFSPDGTRVATGTVQGSARVFDAERGRELTRLEHDTRVRAVAFSADGSQVATGSDGGWARVFDAESGRELTRLDHGDAEVWAVAFSPRGTRLATGTLQGLALVFDTGTWGELARLEHDEPVQAVAFNPDGTKLATGSAERSARVFDADTWQELARLEHQEEVLEVKFSQDGTTLATGSRDGLIRTFAVTPDLLLKHAYRVMSRPLEDTELRRYSLSPECLHLARWNREHPTAQAEQSAHHDAW